MRKGIRVSAVKIDDTGLRLITYTGDCPELKEAYKVSQNTPFEHQFTNRVGEDMTFSSVGCLEIRSTVRVMGNKRTLRRDITARGWTATFKRDGDCWEITRTS